MSNDTIIKRVIASKRADPDKKLQYLCDYYDMSIGEFMDEYMLESIIPGICMNVGCNNIEEYEPDQNRGWCEVCGTTSVKSLFCLLGVM